MRGKILHSLPWYLAGNARSTCPARHLVNSYSGSMSSLRTVLRLGLIDLSLAAGCAPRDNDAHSFTTISVHDYGQPLRGGVPDRHKSDPHRSSASGPEWCRQVAKYGRRLVEGH